MKIVINRCYGGFGLSKKGVEWLVKQGSEEAEKALLFEGIFDSYYVYHHDRSHPLLVQCVEELGEESFGQLSDLKIVEIPDHVDYVIDDYDGLESVHESHRTWS